MEITVVVTSKKNDMTNTITVVGDDNLLGMRLDEIIMDHFQYPKKQGK